MHVYYNTIMINNVAVDNPLPVMHTYKIINLQNVSKSMHVYLCTHIFYNRIEFGAIDSHASFLMPFTVLREDNFPMRRCVFNKVPY